MQKNSRVCQLGGSLERKREFRRTSGLRQNVGYILVFNLSKYEVRLFGWLRLPSRFTKFSQLVHTPHLMGPTIHFLAKENVCYCGIG